MTGASTPEGYTFTGDGSFTDPGWQDTWTATVDYGDGSGAEPLWLDGNTFWLDHYYEDSGTYTLTVTVTDDDGGVGIRTFTVVVANVAPTASFSGDEYVSWGSPAYFSFAAEYVPSEADTAAGLLYSFDFDNDGVLEIADGSDPDAQFTFLEAGPHTVRGRVKDKDGGFTDYWLEVYVYEE